MGGYSYFSYDQLTMVKGMVGFITFMSLLIAVSSSAEILKDDFEDGKLDGWTISGTWEPFNGAVAGTGVLFLDEIREADLVIQCDVMLDDCLGVAGILVRYANWKGFVGAIGAIPDGLKIGCGRFLGELVMIDEKKGHYRLLGGKVTFTGIVARKWYRLTVEAHQGTIWLSLDDVPWKSYNCVIREGMVGLHASGRARFDNFAISDWTSVNPGSGLTTTWGLIKK